MLSRVALLPQTGQADARRLAQRHLSGEQQISSPRLRPAPGVALLLHPAAPPMESSPWATQFLPRPDAILQSEEAVRASQLELEASAKLQHAARQVARLQHQARSLDLSHSSLDGVHRLRGLLGHLEEVETEVEVHRLVLQSLHDHPDHDCMACEHDPVLRQQAAQVVHSRKVQGLAAMLDVEAAAGVDSESLEQTETEALLANLELEIEYRQSQFTELSEQLAAMKADPANRFNPSDPLAACRWQRVLHAHTRVNELEMAILVRQLLLRNLRANPDGCSHSVHDPALEYEASQIIARRKLLEKQLSEAVGRASKQAAVAPHMPAALLLLTLVAVSTSTL